MLYVCNIMIISAHVSEQAKNLLGSVNELSRLAKEAAETAAAERIKATNPQNVLLIMALYCEHARALTLESFILLIGAGRSHLVHRGGYWVRGASGVSADARCASCRIYF
jgi:hypothetical protein